MANRPSYSFVETLFNAIARLPSHPQERGREMVEFLTEMPTATKIFLVVAVLGLAATLIVLKWVK
jgi:hypothetical protein